MWISPLGWIPENTVFLSLTFCSSPKEKRRGPGLRRVHRARVGQQLPDGRHTRFTHIVSRGYRNDRRFSSTERSRSSKPQERADDRADCHQPPSCGVPFSGWEGRQIMRHGGGLDTDEGAHPARFVLRRESTPASPNPWRLTGWVGVGQPSRNLGGA